MPARSRRWPPRITIDHAKIKGRTIQSPPNQKDRSARAMTWWWLLSTTDHLGLLARTTSLSNGIHFPFPPQRKTLGKGLLFLEELRGEALKRPSARSRRARREPRPPSRRPGVPGPRTSA